MHYFGALKRVFSDIPLYLILSLLIFIPGANIAIIGYLVSLAGRCGSSAPFGKFIDRFLEGFQIILIALMYAVIPLVIHYFYSTVAASIFLILILPAFLFSITMLGNGVNLGDILDFKTIMPAYSNYFLSNLLKAFVFSLLVFLGLLIIPFVGWIGILFGPLAVFITLIGETYQDYNI